MCSEYRVFVSYLYLPNLRARLTKTFLLVHGWNVLSGKQIQNTTKRDRQRDREKYRETEIGPQRYNKRKTEIEEGIQREKEYTYISVLL